MGLQDPTAVTVLVLWAALPLPPALHCRCCCRCRKDPAPPLPPWQQQRLLRKPGRFRWAEGSAGGRGSPSLGGRVPSAEGDWHELGRAGALCVRACVRVEVGRMVLWFARVMRAQRARFFFSPLQKRVRLLWISCVSGSLTGVFEVSSAARTAFLLKSFVWIGSVFSPEPGTRHARILLFWCL